MLLYAATDPEFLDTAQTEMIKILAGQATVAIRNALLYREVPLIGLLEPLMQKKRRDSADQRKSATRLWWRDGGGDLVPPVLPAADEGIGRGDRGTAAPGDDCSAG